jgi:hypothetical protein
MCVGSGNREKWGKARPGKAPLPAGMPYRHTYGMIKRTFVLDDESSAYLDRAAERTGMSKSQVVREALRVYGEQLGRLTPEERERLLDIFDRKIDDVPGRPRGDVEAELTEVARARRGGGRRRA